MPNNFEISIKTGLPIFIRYLIPDVGGVRKQISSVTIMTKSVLAVAEVIIGFLLRQEPAIENTLHRLTENGGNQNGPVVSRISTRTLFGHKLHVSDLP